MLRKKGVVEKFVEFYGSGLSSLSVADRATIGNMSPEYGATIGFFPVDNETLRYLRLTGRDPELVELVERYTKEQGLFRTDSAPEPEFSQLLELDLGTVEPSLAGPRRPQDRVTLSGIAESIRVAFPTQFTPATNGGGDGAIKMIDANAGTVSRLPTRPTEPEQFQIEVGGRKAHVQHGSVAIAAITSCTNTSN